MVVRTVGCSGMDTPSSLGFASPLARSSDTSESASLTSAP